jgi:hypothetical protein
MLRIRRTSLFERDMSSHLAWLAVNQGDPGALIQAVDRLIADIAHWHDLGSPVHGLIHVRSVPQMPFRCYLRQHGNEVALLRLRHQRQRPLQRHRPSATGD